MNFEIQDQKIISLTSADGIQSNGSFLSALTFPFKSILVDDPRVTYVTCGLLNAQIPISFYTINETNDTLTFQYGSDVSKNMIVNHGNYNSNSLITEMQTLFTALGYSFTIATSRVNGRVTFTSLSNFTFYDSTIFSILGFVPNTTYVSSSFKLTSVYPLNLLGIKNIKVVSNNLVVNSYDSKNMATTTCIANIPVNVPSYSMLDYVNMTLMFPILNLRVLNVIDINLLDENNNYINFNGTHWSMTLQINTHRQMSYNTRTLHDALYIDNTQDPGQSTLQADSIPSEQQDDQSTLQADSIPSEPLFEQQEDIDSDALVNPNYGIDPDEEELQLLESN